MRPPNVGNPPADDRSITFYGALFAVGLAVTVYVILDLECPRVGLIQTADSDHALLELRQSMRSPGGPG